MMKEVAVTFTEQSNHPPITVAFGTKTSTALELSGCAEFKSSGPWNYDDNPIVAVLINNELRSLTDPIEFSAEITPVRLFSEFGKRMYRHSLSFLLMMAVRYSIPDRDIVIGHSLGDGYYFCFNDDLPVTDELTGNIEKTMRELAEADLRIDKILLSYREALRWLKKAGRDDSVELLDFQNTPFVELYQCGEFRDVTYEPLLPTTALISRFELKRYENGMLLRYPRSADPHTIAPFKDNPVLFSIFEEYSRWGSILSVPSLGRLNRLCKQRNINSFIHIAELLQNKKISRIADAIGQRRSRSELRFVLIAGPSSSGKTTFARKLNYQLQVLGLKPLPISLDDYYLDREKVPLDDEGKPDLEELEALDIRRLNDDLLSILRSGSAVIPRFDFQTAKRTEKGNEVKLPENGIIILEGIHGLNPRLTPDLPDSSKFKIYISALTQLNIDNHNRISTTDNRIIRRIVRDHNFRGMEASATLSMWPSVHRGEKNNIFPYQNNADVAFNSALDYELAVLRPYAEPLLKTIKPDDPNYWHAVRLLTFLDKFYPVPSHKVPDDSLLREFIGDSIFYNGFLNAD